VGPFPLPGNLRPAVLWSADRPTQQRRRGVCCLSSMLCSCSSPCGSLVPWSAVARASCTPDTTQTYRQGASTLPGTTARPALGALAAALRAFHSLAWTCLCPAASRSSLLAHVHCHVCVCHVCACALSCICLSSIQVQRACVSWLVSQVCLSCKCLASRQQHSNVAGTSARCSCGAWSGRGRLVPLCTPVWPATLTYGS
jgi:hypothetical protein